MTDVTREKVAREKVAGASPAVEVATLCLDGPCVWMSGVLQCACCFGILTDSCRP